MNQDKITEVFVEVDDFCQKFKKQSQRQENWPQMGLKKTEIELLKCPIPRLLLS